MYIHVTLMVHGGTLEPFSSMIKILMFLCLKIDKFQFLYILVTCPRQTK